MPRAPWTVALAAALSVCSGAIALPAAAVLLPQPCLSPTTCTVPLNPPLTPKFKPTWLMNESTIVMPCNDGSSAGGWSNGSFFGSFGIADFDWSATASSAAAASPGQSDTSWLTPDWCEVLAGNAKHYWSAAKPMDCQERLVQQAHLTKSASPKAKVWVYRNLVRAAAHADGLAGCLRR